MDENAAKSGGNNKGMMLIIMAMLGLIIVALAGVGVFLIMNMGSMGGDGETVIVSDFGPEPPPGPEEQIMFELGSAVTTNLFSRPGETRRVIRLDITLGINNLDEDEAVEFMTMLRAREMVVIDAIHSILRRTTGDDLAHPDGHELLRENIVDSLQTIFNTNMIVTAYMQINVMP